MKNLIKNTDGVKKAIVKTIGPNYNGVLPIQVDNTKREISIDSTNFLDITTTNPQLVKGDTTFQGNVFINDANNEDEPTTLRQLGLTLEEIDKTNTQLGLLEDKVILKADKTDVETNYLNKTTTEKQYLAGDLNVKGKLQTTQKAEFNVDVLRLEDGNDLYVPKTGNSTFGSLVGGSLTSNKLYNREDIAPNANGKTAINKEYLEKQLKGKDYKVNIPIDTGNTIEIDGVKRKIMNALIPPKIYNIGGENLTQIKNIYGLIDMTVFRQRKQDGAYLTDNATVQNIGVDCYVQNAGYLAMVLEESVYFTNSVYISFSYLEKETTKKGQK